MSAGIPMWARTLRLLLTRGPGRLLVPLVAVLLAVAAVWLVPAQAEIVRASAGGPGGALRVSAPGDGGTVFSVGGLQPGDVVPGSLVVRNDGMLPRTITLSVRDLVDEAGIGGGTLSSRLELLVEDAGGAPGAAPYYRGTLAGAAAGIPIGRLGPGEERSLRMTLTFPDTGEPGSATTGDNAFQAARSTFALRLDGPEDAAPPTQPGGGTQPGGAAQAAAGSAGLQTAGTGGPTTAGTSGKRPKRPKATCASRRSFPIRLRIPRSFRGRIRSIRVTVDGRRIPVRRLKRYVARVDLKGRPKRRYAVRIVVTRVDGARSVDVRRYRTCRRVVKKPGKGGKPKLVVEAGVAAG